MNMHGGVAEVWDNLIAGWKKKNSCRRRKMMESGNKKEKDRGPGGPWLGVVYPGSQVTNGIEALCQAGDIRFAV